MHDLQFPVTPDQTSGVGVPHDRTHQPGIDLVFGLQGTARGGVH